MKLLIVIPAYNEEESLPAVIADLRAVCPQYDYLVVNDGSTDTTAALCRKNGYNLLDLSANLGLAGAFQAGLLYAARNGFDAALQFDADGQHLAKYVEPLVQELEKGYDIVIGSRYVTVPKPITLRMFGSFLISFAMRFATGHKICDPTSGMRIFGRKMIEIFAQNLNYPPEPDTISYLLHCGAKVHEVQVEVAPRLAGKSYLTFFRSARYMLTTSISILLIQWFRKNDLETGREISDV
ncbi:glycosyltransferase family 2 protein [Ruminococcaceae bacterium OttesenSCG-928-O06]|nr:glycosyltransferase family 2 protein [Ruminococcaceae bacterium OttesenSCG-928-O06]